jgi:nuclear pore complex protein Nup155
VYADAGSYYDICLLIYAVADHRHPSDIRTTWQNLLEQVHAKAEADRQAQPWEAVADEVRRLGNRLNLSEFTFPINDLVPLLERYAFEYQKDLGPPTWVIDVFLDLNVPCESIFAVLEGMLYNDEPPFDGPNRRVIANEMLYVAQKWFQETSRGTGRLFGSDGNAASMLQTLQVMRNMLSPEKMEECQALRARIDQLLR